VLSPLAIGLFAAEAFSAASVTLIVSVMGAFLLRQPATIAVKVASGRRPRADLAPALFWLALYGVICLAALAALVLAGYGAVLVLAIPGLGIFAWHLYLVSRREERGQAGVEIVATGALSLAAPAAYWVGLGRYDPLGWALWLLPWLQSAASIVHAYLRLSQRTLQAMPDRRVRWRMGLRAAIYTSFNLGLALVTSAAGLLPQLIWLPYLLQWLETLWAIEHPAVGVKPTRIGIRQLIVSTLFTILFIITWRL
jgi:hypothetical protein